ncbi:MAG: 50S ribosomal protein L21 [Armatimonadetes bacterium]|nr:50S ribosomal protein L21 [Armatimonadota bacterium]
MYAILETGGKQYRAAPEEDLVVEKLAADLGQVVEFDRVALLERDGKVTVGTPWVKNAKVTCRVIEHGKGPKIEVFFFKPKENLKRKKGHRQPFTRLRVEKITVSRSRSKKESSDGA